MSYVQTGTSDQRNLRTLRGIIGIGVAALLVSLASGALLLLLDPVAGSSTEAALGITAAISGLTTGVAVIAALIFTQVKHLWRFVPTPLRIALWALVAVGLVVTAWSLVSQPFQG